MARMSREFSLVLLGAGLLTAGYFLLPESDPVELATKEAENGGNNQRAGRGYARTGHVLIFYSSTGTTRPFASNTATSTMRGGIGRSSTTIGG